MDAPQTPADVSKSDNGTERLGVEGSTEQVLLGLTGELAEMNVHLGHLSHTQPRIERRTRRQTWMNVMVALFVVGAVYLGYMNRMIVTSIEDCLNVSGECYKESRSRAVDGQNRIIDAQRAEAEKSLNVVCGLVVAHGIERPKECE